MQGFLSNVFVYVVFWRSENCFIQYFLDANQNYSSLKWSDCVLNLHGILRRSTFFFMIDLLQTNYWTRHGFAWMMDIPSFPEEINMNIYTYHTRSSMKTDSIQIAPLKTESNDKKVFLCAICFVYVIQYVKVFLTAL